MAATVDGTDAVTPDSGAIRSLTSPLVIISYDTAYHMFTYPVPNATDTAGDREDEHMSVTESRPTGGSELKKLPTFGLSYLFDDEKRPSEVTLYPESSEADFMTEWLTADVADAVPLEDVR